MPRLRIAAAALLALSIPLADARAQADAAARGRVVEHVRARADATRTYAVYLPPTWTPSRRWPALLLLDPAAHARAAIDAFRRAAERRGWVLVASEDARNGGGPVLEGDQRALAAMLADAPRRYAVDPRRIYLAGQSGMARFAWSEMPQLDGRVAGLIGASAAFPQSAAEWMPVLRSLRPFAYFGTAGTADFNREEMEDADAALAGTAIPHRLEVFEGEHGWPPPDVSARALDWLQLQAIRAGSAPPDAAFVASLYAAEIARARALEPRSPVDAAAEYRRVAADFHGMRDVTDAAARAVTLERGQAYARERRRREALAARVREYPNAIQEFFQALAASPDGRVPPSAIVPLRIDPLRAERSDSVRSRDAAQAATRMLTTLSVAAGGAGKNLIADGRYAQAAAALRVALMAKPNDPPVCYNLARATAALGRADEAFAALRCAVGGHAAKRADLESEPLFASIRRDPRFAAIARGAQ